MKFPSVTSHSSSLGRALKSTPCSTDVADQRRVVNFSQHLYWRIMATMVTDHLCLGRSSIYSVSSDRSVHHTLGGSQDTSSILTAKMVTRESELELWPKTSSLLSWYWNQGFFSSITPTSLQQKEERKIYQTIIQWALECRLLGYTADSRLCCFFSVAVPEKIKKTLLSLPHPTAACWLLAAITF